MLQTSIDLSDRGVKEILGSDTFTLQAKVNTKRKMARFSAQLEKEKDRKLGSDSAYILVVYAARCCASPRTN